MRKYRARKASNLVSLQLDGTGFLIKDKRFNPKSGVEISEDIERQTIDGIDDLIDEAQDYLDDLIDLKSDAENL